MPAPTRRRPSTALQAATVLWAIPAVARTAWVGTGFLLGLALIFSAAVLGVIWCVQALFRLRASRVGWRDAAAWAFCPATGALVALLFFTHWPLALRVKLSEPALLRMASAAAAGEEVGGLARLMVVRRVEIDAGAALFETHDGFLFSWWGIAFSADRARPQANYMGYRTSYRHLTGGWWIFEARD